MPDVAPSPRKESDLGKLRRWLRDTNRPLEVALRIVACAGANEDAGALVQGLLLAVRIEQVGGADAYEMRSAATAALKLLPAALGDAVRMDRSWREWGGTSPDEEVRAAAWARLNQGFGGLMPVHDRTARLVAALATTTEGWGDGAQEGVSASSEESDGGMSGGEWGDEEDDGVVDLVSASDLSE